MAEEPCGWISRNATNAQEVPLVDARDESKAEKEAVAKRLRAHIVTATTAAGSGHPSSSLSMVEILTTLYFGGVLRYDVSTPNDPDRDRFILSKGHGAPGLYAALAEAGYFPTADLTTLRKLGSPLEGHPNIDRKSVV